MDERQPLAGAVAIRAGRIGRRGRKTPPSAPWPAPDNRVGGTPAAAPSCPAFTDAHMHLVDYGLKSGPGPVGTNVPTLEEAGSSCPPPAARLARPGEWIRGRGWNRNLWAGGAAFPNRHDLDPVTPDNPVFLPSKDGHAAWANSLALRLAGVTAAHARPARCASSNADARTGEPAYCYYPA